ncbi:MAG: FAD-binding oxidoreductase [Thermoanaerobaculia bacterium]|nr:FAD-binding oxidoreductase [Thermoanaerobaculia bacterium]MBP9826067.1 FAD-binding oxidoreductase [Thermoanaerobaculia bacterium]
MKRTLDLRTGRPVWMAYRAPSVSCSRLRRDARTDVLVVGMGVSGAMVAESLTEAGFRVIVLDRRGPLLGSTPASTALVQHEIDMPLTRLTRSLGRGRSEQAWRRSRLAVANLSARIDELGISCGKVERSSLLLAGNDLGASGLRAEAEARRAAGLYAEYLTRGGLRERFGIARAGAILSPGNLALDPRQLTAGLLLRAIEGGARCHAPAKATAIEVGRDRVTVATADGPVVSAAHVVLATGYELTDLVPATAHAVISTWAIATRPQPRALWPEETLIWESSDPYLYLRTTGDGRILCGGEDEEFADDQARDALIPAKSARLQAKLARLFPSVDARPEFAWTGAFGTTRTGLPFIGKLPQKPRVHAVMGYGGNGITFSRIAAEIVRANLTGATDADAALFEFET